MDIYRAQILDLYRNPQNYGEIKNPDLEAYDLNPLCGDEVKIQAKLDTNHSSLSTKIVEIRFSGNGCAISQASASMLTEMIKGKELNDAKKIEKEDLLFALGINPGPQRLKCALLPLFVWKKSLTLSKNGRG